MDYLANRMSRELTLSDEEHRSMVQYSTPLTSIYIQQQCKMPYMGWLMGRDSKRPKTDTSDTEEQTEKGRKSSKPIYQVSSSRSSSTSSFFRMDTEDSITSQGSPVMTNDEDADDAAQVVESKDRLRPTCGQYHGGFKGKGKEGDFSRLPLSAQRCGGLPACRENVIAPTPEPQPPYRLTTVKPGDDLKRWLLTPNDNIFGQTEERAIAFLQNPRYTNNVLLSTLDLAITEIQSENAHLDSLIEYVAREPYLHHPHPSWDEGLDPAYLSMSTSDFASAERAELEHTLMKAVKELELLRGRVAWVCKRIMGVKQADAKRGDWVEIGDLLRMGAVDEGWVQKECTV